MFSFIRGVTASNIFNGNRNLVGERRNNRKHIRRRLRNIEHLERREMMAADLLRYVSQLPANLNQGAMPAAVAVSTNASSHVTGMATTSKNNSHMTAASSLPGASYPAAPYLTATAVSGSQVNLSWNKVAGASGYLIDEWVNGAWKQIGSFGSGTTGCSITGLSPNTTYYFDVGAYNSSGVAWANYVSAATRVSAPLAPSLTAKAASSTQINLNWNNVAGASGYLIDEWVNGAWKQIGNFSSGTTSFAVTGLNANSTYYFTAAAYNSAGTTWASNYVTATTNSGVTVTIDHPLATTAYTVVNGSLFGANGPVFTDVKQGGVGDCWLMASLAAVAARNPNDIRNMFTYTGTTVEDGATVGLYSVRFFDNSNVARYVTVDTELPSGGLYYDQVTSGVLWVALAEKAYAEANGKGYVTTQHVGMDSYSALEGGYPSWALHAITGQSASEFAINPTNIAAAWNSGKFIVLGSSPNANDNYIVGDSQGTHAYAVVNYTGAGSNPFELFNPWNAAASVNGLINYNGHQVYGGAFWISSSLISQDFAFQSFGSGAAAGGKANGAMQQIAAQFATRLNSVAAGPAIGRVLDAPNAFAATTVPQAASARLAAFDSWSNRDMTNHSDEHASNAISHSAFDLALSVLADGEFATVA